MLRIQLVNSKLGAKTLEIADPIDINTLTQSIKRSQDMGGVMFEMVLDLEFIKDGRGFLKAVYETDGGIDAVVIVNLYEWNPNSRPRWSLAFTGQVNFNRYELSEISVIVNIEQTGIQRRVLNMKEVMVDLETEESEDGTALPPVNSFDVTWHSKVIRKDYEEAPASDIEFQQANMPGFTLPPTGVDVTIDLPYYGQFEMEPEREELLDSFSTPYGFLNLREDASTGLQFAAPGTEEAYAEYLASSTFKKDLRNPKIVIKEDGNLELIDIKLTYKPQVFATNTGGDIDIGGEGCMGNLEVSAWFEHRDQFDNIKTLEMIGMWSTPGVGGNERIGEFETHSMIKENVVVEKGDKFYVYPVYRVYGTYDSPEVLGSTGQVSHDFTIQPDLENTHIIFRQASVDADRDIKTIMIYEAIERCLQFYTNQVDCFKSDLLGRVDIGYAEDGPYSLIGLSNGHRLRGKNILLPEGERGDTMFANLEDLVEFVNTLACVDFGFETDENGVTRFVLEPKEYFFNKDSRIVALGQVYDIKKKLVPSRFYNQFRIGYSTEIDVSQLNAIDEYNTIRQYLIPIINTKNKLEVTTDMITSGYLIENQKRLLISTEDGKHDDDNFAAVVLRDGDSFKTKKNEGYQEITNVLYPETGYNYDISPARIAPNWFKVIAAALIRSTRKQIKFSFGTVNYIMTTQEDGTVVVVAENDDFDLTLIEPIWDNEDYEFTCEITREEIQLIRASPYGYIEFQDRFGNIMEGFISPEGIEYDRNENTATFNLIRVYRP